MLSKTITGALLGIDAFIVVVEANLTAGIPALDIVGLPDSSIKESKERIRVAIKNTKGLEFPAKRITINLAPADTRKGGSSFDLPIAVSILVCMEVVSSKSILDTLFMGELSLDGNIKQVRGVLPIIHKAFKSGYKKCVVPVANSEEASLVEGMEVIGVNSLAELIDFLKGKADISPTVFQRDSYLTKSRKAQGSDKEWDFTDIKGQLMAKRALEIAAAGRHNVLMIGPPGAGKTMLASRLTTILPSMTFEESIELAKIYSVAGLLKDDFYLFSERPFRAPHHTASITSLTGGGNVPSPGEMSFSHHGVLFLDELPEFPKSLLETLRQPMEERKITLSRASAKLTYPTNFMLVAAMNPCPCGYYGDLSRCNCSAWEVSNYMKKISGPLLDRIDLHVYVDAIKYEELESKKTGEKSATIKERVSKASAIQQKRYEALGLCNNAELSAPQIDEFCKLNNDCKALLSQAFQKLSLTARSYHKIIKVARTIADLAGEPEISVRHVGEAIQFRNLDRERF